MLPLMISEDFASIADPRYLRVTEYGGGIGWSVENTRYKTFLHHEFDRLEDGRIAPRWMDKIQQVTEKFAYLRRRWAQMMDGSGQICFVRRFGCMDMPSEQLTETSRADYLRLFSAVYSRAPNARVSYIFIDCQNVPVAENVLDVAIGTATVADWPLAEDRWKGHTIGYDRVFRDVTAALLDKDGQRRRFG